MGKVTKPKPPTVHYGDLTDRERAIAQARVYLNKHVVHRPTPAYLIIADLLGLFDVEELQRIYRKAGIP